MKIRVEAGDWKVMQHPCERVRLMVFVAEQHVPKEEEIDALDLVSTHFVARDEQGMVIGCGRITPEGRIGRLAVLRPWRGRGAGRALMTAILEHARAAGLASVVLNAQTHAQAFYERLGFAAEGEKFDECGIEHIRMTKSL